LAQLSDVRGKAGRHASHPARHVAVVVLHLREFALKERANKEKRKRNANEGPVRFRVFTDLLALINKILKYKHSVPAILPPPAPG
jgi:hypothetical protein